MLNKAKTLTIITKNPSKYLLLDKETGIIMKGSNRSDMDFEPARMVEVEEFLYANTTYRP